MSRRETNSTQVVIESRASVASVIIEPDSIRGTHGWVEVRAEHAIHIQVAERVIKLKAIHETSRVVTMAAAHRLGSRRRNAMAPVMTDTKAHARENLKIGR